MNDKFDYIDLGNGMKVSPTVLDAALIKVGYCIAPLPAKEGTLAMLEAEGTR